MSIKITKKKKIQELLEETIGIITITLEGKEILIDLTKLPPQLKEAITVHARDKFSNAALDTELLNKIKRML